MAPYWGSHERSERRLCDLSAAADELIDGQQTEEQGCNQVYVLLDDQPHECKMDFNQSVT
jgi:hypothetical protein